MSFQMLLTDEYKVSLEVFEGPLDLLLYLIRREELDIYNIPIERITTQYMDFLGIMRMLDLNIAGEFLVMATTLMMIKSRMLLPVEARSAEGEEEEEWVDPRLELVRQLVEYKKFKDVASRMSELEMQRASAFAYGGGASGLTPTGKSAGELLADIGLFDLLAAFQDMLERLPLHPLERVEPARWSVSDKMEAIMEGVAGGGVLHFSELFTPEATRVEIIITFLALLELLRLDQVRARQDEVFHEIVVLAADPADGMSRDIAVIGGGGEHVQS